MNEYITKKKIILKEIIKLNNEESFFESNSRYESNFSIASSNFSLIRKSKNDLSYYDLKENVILKDFN